MPTKKKFDLGKLIFLITFSMFFLIVLSRNASATCVNSSDCNSASDYDFISDDYYGNNTCGYTFWDLVSCADSCTETACCVNGDGYCLAHCTYVNDTDCSAPTTTTTTTTIPSTTTTTISPTCISSTDCNSTDDYDFIQSQYYGNNTCGYSFWDLISCADSCTETACCVNGDGYCLPHCSSINDTDCSPPSTTTTTVSPTTTTIASTTTTTATPLGSETVQTVHLVTDGIKGFLRAFASPYFIILIIAFFALLVVGIFALIKKVTGG